MPSNFNLRLQHLEDNIRQDQDLLKEYEDSLRYEDDPRRQGRYKRQIKQLRESANSYQKEYDELRMQITVEPNVQMQNVAIQLQQIQTRIDRLSAGQKAIYENINHLRQGLLARYNTGEQNIIAAITEQLDQSQMVMISTVLDAIETEQVPEREMQVILQGIQQNITKLQRNGTALPPSQAALAEDEPRPEDVVHIYANAGIELPGLVVRRLEEVEIFHRRLIENRREFLGSEIKRIKREIASRESFIREKTEERAELLEVLKTHGALEEHTMLQEIYLDDVANLNEINKRIEELKQFEEEKSTLKIEKEQLLQRARRDYGERNEQAERAINLFSTNSRFLYDVPGTLVIDVGSNGFSFRVEIRRDGSEGIDKMKIFCYDLMLAQLWSERDPSPRILIHDSTIFDGVDERQVSLALQLADRESRRLGFQYICTLNSDMVPRSEFPLDFDFNSFVRLRLTDESEEGGLLGISF